MGTQSTASGTGSTPVAGKTTAPPQPDYGATTNLKAPMAASPTDVTFGQTKPLEMGAPAPAPSGDLWSGNGVRIDSNNVRHYADGSSEQLSSDTVKSILQPNALTPLYQASGPGQVNGGGFSIGGGGGSGSGGVGFGGGGFGAKAVQGPIDDTSRQRVEQAILARLEPQFRQDEASLRNQLLSSGLEVGSPAYTAELDRLQRGQNDARQQAILTGGTEESRQVGMNSQLQGQAFGQGLQGAQFDNATRQQMLAELLMQRNIPLNELNSLRTGSQVSMPNFQGYYTNNSAAAPIFDAAQAQGNYDMAAAQNQQSGFNSMLGGLATLGGAGIMRFSDLRLKTDVKPIGRTAGGHNLYSWKWKDGSGYDTGVIAQEVQQIRPDAVTQDTSGYLMVDYSKIH